jgi:hypothetical protein
VLAKGKTGRAASSEGETLHLEKRDDVLIESGIVPELFDQVEKNVRSEGLQFLAHKIDIVINGKMLGRVTDFNERGHDVCLSFPVLRLQLLGEILIDGCGACAVKKHENFEFLFHDFFCVFVTPSEAEKSLDLF